jgi:hypothetical protein
MLTTGSLSHILNVIVSNDTHCLVEHIFEDDRFGNGAVVVPEYGFVNVVLQVFCRYEMVNTVD